MLSGISSDSQSSEHMYFPDEESCSSEKIKDLPGVPGLIVAHASPGTQIPQPPSPISLSLTKPGWL